MSHSKMSSELESAPTSTVEVSISCRNLLDKDVFSRSDPMCVIYQKPFASSKWEECLRTEIVWDCLNPEFVKKLEIDYRFAEEQLLRFEIYDIDNKSSPSLQKQDFLGFAECTLGEIISAGFRALTLPLCQNQCRPYQTGDNKTNRNHGTIILLAEELLHLKQEVNFSIEGRALGPSFRLFCFPGSKFFFKLSKINESGNYTLVYKSESRSGRKGPSWNSFSVPMNQLCNGDKDRSLQFQCFVEGMNGYHKECGSCITTLNKLMSIADYGNNQSFDLTGGNKKSRLIFMECKILPIYTFVDYIQSGTQIHCSFAIDFTSSNGDPSTPNSLHYISSQPNVLNPYEQAIQSVGDIIKTYDSTQNFLVHGFGARIISQGIISHKFPVNMDADYPYCHGVSGILKSYRTCIQEGLINLSGPTNFSEIIKDVAKTATENMDGQHYHVLVIITDGIITDMAETKEAIVNASGLPLSIVIVGVGGEDFKEMEELDGDHIRLSSRGITAERDIVQFIPYRDSEFWMERCTKDISNESQQGQWSNRPACKRHFANKKLAQEVLAEIPGQLTSFMKKYNFAPRKLTQNLYPVLKQTGWNIPNREK